jgi:hypothetical protein
LEFLVVLVVVGLVGGDRVWAQNDDLKKLLENYENHLAELAKPVRDELETEIKAVEKKLFEARKLEAGTALRRARLAYFLKAPGQFFDDRFPIDAEAFATAHGEAGAGLAVVWNRYEARIEKGLVPLRQKLIVELGKLEKRLKDSDYSQANRVREYRESYEGFMDWPNKIESLPKGTQEFGGRFYLLSEDRLAWNDAMGKCDALDGHLATITSKAENDFVQRLSGGKDCWLGGTERHAEGRWLWVTGEPFEYSNWHPGEPNKGGELYLCFNSATATWRDAPGRNRYRFLCEWERPLPRPVR